MPTTNKSANVGKLLRPVGQAIGKFADMSVWRGVGKLADRRLAAGGGMGWKATKGVADTLGGGVGTGLGIYGLAGLAVPSLPGASTALNIGMPGWAAATSAPNVIRSARMTRADNQEALRRDVQAGSQFGADDFLTAVATDPSILQRTGGFAEFMKQRTGSFAGDSYMRGNTPPPAGFADRMRGVFVDSNKMVNDEVRRGVSGVLNKQGGLPLAAIGSKLMSAGGMALKGLMPVAAAAGAYEIGNAALSDKPYDPLAAQQEGYAGAQAGVQKRLNNASGWERLAMRVDPTLAASGLNEKMPGAIDHWMQNTGARFTPGWLSNMKETWRTGGTPSYYTYDAAGNRHYT